MFLEFVTHNSPGPRVGGAGWIERADRARHAACHGVLHPRRRRAFRVCVRALGLGGPGSGLRGHALVDAVVALGKHVPALSAARLTIVWYLVPALGAAAWIACGLTGPRSTPSRIVAAAALIAALVAVVAFARLVGTARLGWGPKLASGRCDPSLRKCMDETSPGASRRKGHRPE